MTIKENIDISLTSSKDAYDIMQGIYNKHSEQDKTKEHFYILGLNAKNKINYIELVSMGTLTSSLVHPREVFKIAIMKDSASIIACHNHPSGDVTPSRDDINITKRLKEAGAIIGITLLDHLIISGKEYISLTEKGIV